ncbi:MAG: zinc ribbon domain-containing protein [Balneolaceae bacterium]
MPTYEYKREDGTTFEISQRMSEDSLTICPTTGQKVKRVISGGSGVVYKGEGWYVTDYKNGSNKDTSTSPKTTTKTSEKTTDSNPESSTDK